MTLEVAALLALALLSGLAFVVLPSLNYPGLATLSLVAMFVFAIMMRRALGKNPEVTADEIVQPTPESRATVTKERKAMTTTVQSEGSFRQFLGVMVAASAYVIVAAVVIYWWSVFWNHTPPDFNLLVHGQKIPAETYPILLLTFWSLSQRGMAHWQPQHGTLGAVFWWLDLVSSLLVAAFLGFTFFKAIIGGQNLTFLLVLGAYVVQGVGDIVLNGRHLYGAAGESAVMPQDGIITDRSGNVVQIVRQQNGSLVYNVYCNGQGARILPPLNPGDPPQVEVLAA